MRLKKQFLLLQVGQSISSMQEKIRRFEYIFRGIFLKIQAQHNRAVKRSLRSRLLFLCRPHCAVEWNVSRRSVFLRRCFRCTISICGS